MGFTRPGEKEEEKEKKKGKTGMREGHCETIYLLFFCKLKDVANC